MFRAILMTQWKWGRQGLVLISVAALVLPLFAVSLVGAPAGNEFDVRLFLLRVQLAGLCYAILAFAAGAWLAGTAWNTDSTNQYVYVMSLPVPRWHFVMLRFGAGALLLLAPALAVLIGGVVVTQLASVPSTLNTYALALTARFILASVLSYALWFGFLVRKGAGLYIVGAFIVFMVAAITYATLSPTAAINTVLETWFNAGGMFSVYSGRWMLIDV